MSQSQNTTTAINSISQSDVTQISVRQLPKQQDINSKPNQNQPDIWQELEMIHSWVGI